MERAVPQVEKPEPEVKPAQPPAVIAGPNAAPAAGQPADEAPALALKEQEKPRPVRPTLERLAPRVVDVDAHLADRLPAVSFHQIPLDRILAEITRWSTIPITIDADSLAEMNLSCDLLVDAQLKDTTIAGLLEAALAPHGLGYTVVGNQLLVGRKPSPEPREVRYSVADLTGANPAAQGNFTDFVRAMIEPASWQERGGPAACRWSDNVLFVNQTDRRTRPIVGSLRKTSRLRGLPLRSRLDAARFRLDSRIDLAAGALNQSVSASYGRPEPLSHIVEHLGGAAKVHLLVDGVALAEQQTSVDTEALLAVDRQPLRKALASLTEPLDLTWRAVDERTIEITSAQAAARHAEIVFHAVRGLVEGDVNAAGLIARIERAVGPAIASDAPSAGLTMRYDAPSGRLLVRAPQAVQSRIAALLNNWQVAKQ